MMNQTKCPTNCVPMTNFSDTVAIASIRNTNSAIIPIGNITLPQEANREMRGIRFIESVIQDLRYGLWMLRRNPGGAFVAALTLALGIGANTAMFSVVNAVLLRPLPFPESERLMFVEADNHARFAAPDFRDLATQNRSFWRVSAYTDDMFNLSGGAVPERVNGARISAGLLPTLGALPLHGR